MADEAGGVTPEVLEALNLFLNEVAGEEGIGCPLSGEAVALTEWHAPGAVAVLAGKDGGAGFEVLPLVSPAGGVVLVSLAKVEAWRKAQGEREKEGR